jgi:predicted RNA binding protein YcfA (HicA-like mRNA interferase family)
MAETLSQKSAQRLLEQHGSVMTRGGKHNVKMEKPGHRPITVPMHNGADYRRSLSAAIIRQAGLP